VVGRHENVKAEVIVGFNANAHLAFEFFQEDFALLARQVTVKIGQRMALGTSPKVRFLKFLLSDAVCWAFWAMSDAASK
jgi:hypothetical protein